MTKIHYSYFHLDTLQEDYLFKIYWKLISQHHFKKINQDNNDLLEYVKAIFHFQFRRATRLFEKSKKSSLFWKDFNIVFDNEYLKNLQGQLSLQQNNFVKRLFVSWSGQRGDLTPVMKSKKIKKPDRKKMKRSKNIKINKTIGELNEQQKNLNIVLNKIYEGQQKQQQNRIGDKNLDEQIQKLELQLLENQIQNKFRISQIEQKMQSENNRRNRSLTHDQYDIKCFQWLINNLQGKQIAQSIVKMNRCEKINGENMFSCSFQNAMSINDQYYSEKQIQKINSIRENSLFKFYKTGVKSLYSHICNNKLGLIDMVQHRMDLAKFKDKNYLQYSKKMTHMSLNQLVQNEIENFDACHQCKYMYPSHLLHKCKFRSERTSCAKVIQSEYQPCVPNSHEKQQVNIRTSQRFVAKQNNYTSYPRIDQQYVCGRSYCKVCLKDNYGIDWFKLNHQICPFCQGICNCTRCLRNQKINKIKIYHNQIGGNIVKLQEKSKFDQLFQEPKQHKVGLNLAKTKLIHKQSSNKYKQNKYNKSSSFNLKKSLQKYLDEESTQKSNISQRQFLKKRTYKASRKSSKFY